jgi:hypothetical protein
VDGWSGEREGRRGRGGGGDLDARCTELRAMPCLFIHTWKIWETVVVCEVWSVVSGYWFHLLFPIKIKVKYARYGICIRYAIK